MIIFLECCFCPAAFHQSFLVRLDDDLGGAPVAGNGDNSSTMSACPPKGSLARSHRAFPRGRFNICCMKTWSPMNNEKFEALSYLPLLSDDSIAKESDYMLKKKWIPCLEFDEVGYVHRENSRMLGYYDGRYWTLWKLPMFGCNDASQVFREIQECKKAYPNAYISCLAFDNKKQQVQCMAFVIQKPHAPVSSSA